MREQLASGTSEAERPVQAHRLAWSLTVCTYKREKVLPRCIRCAIESTRRPSEVIIVDASPYWQTTRDAVLAEFEAGNPDINFVYVQARRASLTAQRNQGLEMTSGDIAFMLDDDSLLYPDAAERIMEVFEADVTHSLVSLTPMFVPVPPDAAEQAGKADQPVKGHGGKDESKSSFLRRWMRNFLWSNKQLLPYDGRDAKPPLPEAIRNFGVIPALFSTGSACFRTAVVREAGFEEMLERYAAGEDWDICERIKHRGQFGFVPAARQCHLVAAGGRLSQATVSMLTYFNFLALHVVHSTDPARSQRQYRQMLWRRLLSDTLSDLAKRRWKLPRARGAWRALKMMPRFFAMSPQELRKWYPQFQREIIAADNG